ncbi:hypothetical protein ACFLWX_03485 [Chloroflexota bacterium]
MQESTRSMLRDTINMTEEDMNKLSPGLQKLLDAVPEVTRYKVIAEVTDVQYCFAGLKVGDKLVFGPPPNILNVEESTCALCLDAIAPLAEHVRMMMDRMAEGLDPNDAIYIYGECFDRGIEHGGLGKVWFKLSAQKM